MKNANGDNTIDIANKLSSISEVEFAEPNFITEIKKDLYLPNGKYFSQEWHLYNTAQSNGLNGEDIDALELGNYQMGKFINSLLLHG